MPGVTNVFSSGLRSGRWQIAFLQGMTLLDIRFLWRSGGFTPPLEQRFSKGGRGFVSYEHSRFPGEDKK